jgi:hypothetical protein
MKAESRKQKAEVRVRGADAMNPWMHYLVWPLVKFLAESRKQKAEVRSGAFLPSAFCLLIFAFEEQTR